MRETVCIVARAWDQKNVCQQADRLDVLNAFAQRVLKRPRESERRSGRALSHYKHISSRLDEAQHDRIIALCGQLGDLDRVEPKRRSHDYILIHGGPLEMLRQRVWSVAEAVREGSVVLLPTTQVVFLDGERELDGEEGEAISFFSPPYRPDPTWEAAVEMPEDERDLVEIVWRQLDLPPELRAVSPTFVHAAKRPGTYRVQTFDTVREGRGGGGAARQPGSVHL